MVSEMAKHVRTTIRYDGPALAGHEMDVQDLAPALLALADIIQITNKKFNGDDASIKVLVNADVEQRCFMIDISLVQSFLDQAKVFLGTDHVKTAADIAQWIGIIGGGGTGLFNFIKFLSGRKKTDPPLQIKSDGDGNVTVSGNGNTITVSRAVYQLALDPKLVEKAKVVMRPLEKDGYETLSFLENGDEVFEVESAEVGDILSLPSAPLSEIPTESTSQIRGQVRIKSAQYEGGAQWGFLWNGRSINAEMIDKAADWVKEFQDNRVSALPHSILDVSMLEVAQLDAQGMIVGKPSYRVTEVHGVTPPPSQSNLFDD